MKKIYPLVIMALFSLHALFAGTVNADYALQVAQNFYQQTTGTTATFSLVYQSLNQDASNGLPVGTPLYYVFNAAHDKGFVMVSAEDLVKPIIGYNTQGHFGVDHAPLVIADWLNKYNKQIAYVKVNRSATTATITKQWSNYYNNIVDNTKGLRAGGAVGPLLTTTWDQDLYYNALCPADASSPYGYGGNVPTGCGATAMSQIMRYWSYPATGTGSHSYNSNYGTLSADFGATTYNWNNMPNALTSPNTDVATIMFDCGVAVEMTYTPNESTSYMLSGTGVNASCQAAYTTYFGYDPAAIQGYVRANYTDGAWATMIETELAASRPIQYAGSGPEGGHTFVLDGSDGNGNYHINWGWSGTDNGYYSFNQLDPAPQPNGSFDQYESMINGIQPLNLTTVTSTMELEAAITLSANPVAFGQALTVTSNFFNNGTTSFTGNFCAALFDATGTFLRYIGPVYSTGNNPLLAGNYYASPLQFTDTATGVTAPGTYTIGMYYLPTGTSNWMLAGANTFTNPVSVQFDGPTNANISLYANIVANPTTFFQGQAASVTLNLINNGSAAYTGQYEVVLLDLFGNVVEEIGPTYTESTGIPAGDYYNGGLTFTTNSITAPEGKYFLAVGEEQSGTSQWYYCGSENYNNPVPISVINGGFAVSVKETTLSNVKIYPNPTSNYLNVEAPTAQGNYTLKVFNTIGQQMMQNNGVINGQKLSIDVSGFAPGIYIVQLKAETGTLEAKFIVE